MNPTIKIPCLLESISQKWGGIAALLVSTLAISSSVEAATLIGNLPQTDDSAAISVFTTTRRVAVGFTLPTGINYTLDNITLRLGGYLDSVDTPLLQIYADSAKTSTSPTGTTLQSVALTKPTSNSGSISNLSFIPASSFIFQADTRYWLSLGASAGAFSWNRSALSKTPTGVSGIGFDGYQFSDDSGATYSSLPVQFYTFQIDATPVSATAVPEPTSPASYVVLLAGLVAGRKLLKSRAAKPVLK